MTRRDETPPFGLLAFPKLIESPHSFLRSGLQPEDLLCPLLTSGYLTRDVAIQGTAEFAMREVLSVSWFRGLMPANSQRTCQVLGLRVNPFRTLVMSLLPRGKKISPDKRVNFPCTAAAFTLHPEPVGFVVLCQLARG
jgi:hypothetical protein